MRVSRGECVCVVATINSIRHTLDAPALEYVPATQSVHSEAAAVQAQRQTARSSRDFEIQKHARSSVCTMHSSLCSPCPCPTHARCYPACSRCITHTRMRAAGCHWLPRHMCTHAYACMSTHAKERGGKGGQRSRHSLDAPVALEYLPATHRVHVAADDEDDPWVPYLPAAHAEPEHELAPVALEYFPATQKVHAAPDSADPGGVW